MATFWNILKLIMHCFEIKFELQQFLNFQKYTCHCLNSKLLPSYKTFCVWELTMFMIWLFSRSNLLLFVNDPTWIFLHMKIIRWYDGYIPKLSMDIFDVHDCFPSQELLYTWQVKLAKHWVFYLSRAPCLTSFVEVNLPISRFFSFLWDNI